MTIQFPKSIRDNLRFLCVEVDSQVTNLQTYLAEPSAAVARRIIDRRGYAYNLKIRIHKSCLNAMTGIKDSGGETPALRGVEFIATGLERITELCRDSIKQMGYLSDPKCLDAEALIAMLSRVRRGIALVEPAIQESDTRQALKIGQLEDKLDRDYNKLLKQNIDALKRQKNTEDLAGALFVAHSIEQMGDALLDISESIISANLGQPVNFERYQSLQASVERLGSDESVGDMQVESIAETRSGSSISGLSKDKKDDYFAIYKEGEKRKLKEERQGVKNWHEIYPGLAPKILSYKKSGKSASLLIEHLPGLTFEQILLNEPRELLDETLQHLAVTLNSVWDETHTNKPISAKFMQQLKNRLEEVYKLHPEFRQGDSQVCGLNVPSFDSLVKQATEYEVGLQAPFSVYIHGDFNIDNIIYDPMEQRINFIDLHRSRYMDYVQDVSVFMVSNYRLQIIDAEVRRKIMQLAQDFYQIARRYAAKIGDYSFELRLALGLARSFATSTRFILDKSLAQSMIMRARYLIEYVLATDPKKAASFSVPVKEIFVG